MRSYKTECSIQLAWNIECSTYSQLVPISGIEWSKDCQVAYYVNTSDWWKPALWEINKPFPTRESFLTESNYCFGTFLVRMVWIMRMLWFYCLAKVFWSLEGNNSSASFFLGIRDLAKVCILQRGNIHPDINVYTSRTVTTVVYVFLRVNLIIVNS